MHPTLKSKPVPVFLLAPNSLLTGWTDWSLSEGLKRRKCLQWLQMWGPYKATSVSLPFIISLSFSLFFTQVMRRNGSTWGPSDDEEARSELKHTFTGTQMHWLCFPLAALDIYKTWGIKKRKRKDCCTRRNTWKWPSVYFRGSTFKQIQSFSLLKWDALKILPLWLSQQSKLLPSASQQPRSHFRSAWQKEMMQGKTGSKQPENVLTKSKWIISEVYLGEGSL